MVHASKEVLFLPRPSRASLASPTSLLKRYCESRDPQGDGTQYILASRPLLRRIVLRLASYLTDQIPSADGRPHALFDHALDIATAEWQFCTRKSTDPGRANAYFMRGLLAPLPHVLEITILAPMNGDLRAWDPTEIALQRWAKKADGHLIVRNVRPDGYWRDWLPVDYRSLVMLQFLCREPPTRRLVAPYVDFIIAR